MPKKKDNILYKGAVFLALFLILSYALSFGARQYWFCDLFRHFIFQYFIGSLTFLVFFTWKKSHFFILALGLVALGTFYEIVTTLKVSNPIAEQNNLSFKVAHYNRRYTIADHSDMIDWVRRENPDFFVIQEGRESHSLAIHTLKNIYPHQIHEPRPNAFGMVFASKYPIVNYSITQTKRYALDNFFIHAILELPDKTMLSVYAIHPPPPMAGILFTQRNEDLKQISAAIAEDIHQNIILMGDWNITAYSPFFKDILHKTGLRNEYTSHYIFPTWPSPFVLQLFQIPIDHILFKGDMTLTSRKRSPHMGSDHYPIAAEFHLHSEDKRN